MVSNVTPQVLFNKPAPGVTQHSTHMHGGQTSVHMGATTGSRTANGTEVAGDFKAAHHPMPNVHFNKPQHDSEFVGTHMHSAETSVHKGHMGSQTGAGPDAGVWPA